MKTLITLLSLLIFYTSCSESHSEDLSQFEAAWDGTEGTENFTRYTVSALNKYGESLLDPKHKMKADGYSRYCSKYNRLTKLERKKFWVRFISGLSFLESSFDPTESNGDIKGLLQMDLKSVNNNIYKCNLKKESDLYKAELNINCAVKIMNSWIKRDRRIYGFEKYTSDEGKPKTRWFGVGRYWSPIRLERNTGSKYRRYKKLGEDTNEMGICR